MLLQLMIMPDVLIVENYRTMTAAGIVEPSLDGLPYMASAFGIFLLRQTFKTGPSELDEAARVEGAGLSRFCSNFMCHSPSLFTLLTAWYRSATIGTTSYGH